MKKKKRFLKIRIDFYYYLLIYIENYFIVKKDINLFVLLVII